MSPDSVARATMRAIERHRREITLSWPGWLFVQAGRFAPGFVDWALTRWLLKLFPEAPVLQRREAERVDRRANA
jgi:hypothetical protein